MIRTVFFFAKSPEAPSTTMTVLSLSSMLLSTVACQQSGQKSTRSSSPADPLSKDAHRKEAATPAKKATSTLCGQTFCSLSHLRLSDLPSIGFDLGADHCVRHSCSCKWSVGFLKIGISEKELTGRVVSLENPGYPRTMVDVRAVQQQSSSNGREGWWGAIRP